MQSDTARGPQHAASSWWFPPVVALAYLLFAAATRLGYLAFETIDWDENTFLLIASGSGRGILPYVEYWDMKPPLMFMSLGWALNAFGDTLLTARAYGAVAIAAMSFCVYLVCRSRHGERAAALMGFVTLAGCSITTFQMTMTQHPAIALVMVAMVLTLRGRQSLSAMFAVGVLMSLATLCRANVAVVVVAMGLYLAWPLFRPRPAVHRNAVLVYVAGGLIPLLWVLWVYWSAGQLDLFLFSNLWAAGSYATGTEPAPWLFVKMLGIWVEHAVNFWGTFLPFLLMVLATLYVLHRRRRAAGRKWNSLPADPDSDGFVVGLFGFSMWVSMSLSGGLAPHHLLLVIPFGAIIACNLLVAKDAPHLRRAGYVLATISVFAALTRTLPMSLDVASHWSALKERYPVRAASLAIASRLETGDRVFAVEHQLVYWYLRQPPPYIAATHPSTLTRPSLMGPMEKYGYAPRDAFMRIMAARPRFIVMSERPTRYLRGLPEEKALLDTLSGYDLLTRQGPVFVYERRNSPISPNG